jgi:hypothetical protein
MDEVMLKFKCVQSMLRARCSWLTCNATGSRGQIATSQVRPDLRAINLITPVLDHDLFGRGERVEVARLFSDADAHTACDETRHVRAERSILIELERAKHRVTPGQLVGEPALSKQIGVATAG